MEILGGHKCSSTRLQKNLIGDGENTKSISLGDECRRMFSESTSQKSSHSVDRAEEKEA